MKIGVWNFYEELNYNNYMLLNSSTGIGDDLLKPVNKLYSEGQEHCIDFMTLDMIEDFNNIDGFIFFDFPNFKNEYVEKSFTTNKPKYLIIFESELIRPDNWNLENHKYFSKIFTWHDDFVDNIKYFKINFAQEIPQAINKDLANKEKLCTLIAGNKKVEHPLELYSKRVEAIRWFEKYHSGNFDLYGIGWDTYHFNGPKIIRALNRIKPLTKLLAPSFPSYKGKVERKKEVLEKYKFAICYENARDISGYITEKIFDCLFAGCVPIYLGANNIIEHIPKECFIDKRDFESYEELYVFMHNMSDDDYSAYLKAIEKFLNSDKIYPFSSEYFAKIIVDTLLDDTKNQ